MPESTVPAGAMPAKEQEQEYAKRLHDMRGYCLRICVSRGVKAGRLGLEGIDEEQAVTFRILYWGPAGRGRKEIRPEGDPRLYAWIGSPFPEEPDQYATWGIFRDSGGSLWTEHFSQAYIKDPGLYDSGWELVFEAPECVAAKEPVLRLYANDEKLCEETIRTPGIHTVAASLKNVSSDLVAYMMRTRLHQKKLLDEVERICGKYGLRYYLVCGGLIGVLRDGGLIPWDDDLDIAMTREDYDAFEAAAEKEWAEEKNFLWITSADYGNDAFFDYMTRIVYMAETSEGDAFSRLGESGRRDIRGHQVLDVYILENASDSRVKRYVQAKKLQLLYVLALGHRGTEMIKNNINHGALTLKAAGMLRRIGSRIPLKTLLAAYRRVTGKNRGRAGKYYYFSNGYYKTIPLIYKREWFGEGKRLDIQGQSINVPYDADAFLQAMYGDYMMYPPLWDRMTEHRHCRFGQKEKSDRSG